MGHALEDVNLLYACLLHRAVAMDYSDVLPLGESAAVDTSHCNAARVVRVVERCYEHLGCALKLLWGWDYLDNLVKQVVYIVCRVVIILCHPSVLCRAVYDGEVQLVFCGVEREHEVEHHLVDLLRAAIRFVDLVDDDDGLQPYLESLLEHEACLRHRSLESVDKEYAAVGHVEDTLNLTTEIGVARGVYDVYLCPLPVDGDIL